MKYMNGEEPVYFEVKPLWVYDWARKKWVK